MKAAQTVATRADSEFPYKMFGRVLLAASALRKQDRRSMTSQGKRRMHPYARSIAELRSSLREMLAHDISNPDDDPHLSGVMFFCATDEQTRLLIERIELLASEVLFDPNGRAIAEHMRAAAIDGVCIKRNRKAATDETQIRIALAGKGYITISTARL